MMWLALAMVGTQTGILIALVIGARLGLVKLGQFVSAVEAANKSNVLLHDSNLHVLREIRGIRETVALDTELAAERAANFVQYDPNSDREKIA